MPMSANGTSSIASNNATRTSTPTTKSNVSTGANSDSQRTDRAPSSSPTSHAGEGGNTPDSPASTAPNSVGSSGSAAGRGGHPGTAEDRALDTAQQRTEAVKAAASRAADSMVKTSLNNRNPMLGNGPQNLESQADALGNRAMAQAQKAAEARTIAARAAQQSQYRSPPSVGLGVPRPSAGVVSSNVDGKVSLPGLARDDRAPISLGNLNPSVSNPFNDVLNKSDTFVQGDDGQLHRGTIMNEKQPGQPTRLDVAAPINTSTFYKDPVNPAAQIAAQQAINTAIHRNAQPVAYAADGKSAGVSTVPASPYGTDGQPTTPRTTEPNGTTPPSNIPVPREKPMPPATVDIGAALRSLAPTEAPVHNFAQPTKIQDRAYPNAPLENSAISGQIGTVLSQGVPDTPHLTGAPPDRVMSPNYGAGPAQDVDRPVPPGNFTAADPAQAAALRDLLSQMGNVLSRPKESEIGTVAPTTGTPETQGPASVTAAPVPGASMFGDIGKTLSGYAETGIDTFKDASQKIDAIGGSAVATKLGKFLQFLTGGDASKRIGHRNGGESQDERTGPRTHTSKGGKSDAQDTRQAEYQNLGFTSDEIRKLMRMKGDRFTKELARLTALHKTKQVAPENTALLHQYLMDQIKIRSEAGNGLISF